MTKNKKQKKLSWIKMPINLIDDERVAVLLELAGALEQTEVLFFLAAVIRGVDIAVQIGGKVDRQVSFLHSLTPEPA